MIKHELGYVKYSIYATWIYQLGISWWSEWLEISTHKGVLSQSNLIDDNGISPDKLRDEYTMGQLGPEVRPED